MGDRKLRVSQSLVGRIIGRGGSKIKELEERSGASIRVDSRNAENGEVQVLISGSDDCCREAEDLINEIVETFSDMSRGGGGGRYGGGGGGGYGRRDNYGGGGGGRACYSCGEEGHMARDCSSSARARGGGGGGGRRNFSCYSCGEEGHMSRECTSGGGGGGQYSQSGY